MTRDHGDVDIAVFEPDQGALFDRLTGWHLIAHDEVLGGATTEPWDGHDLVLPAHIHARSPGAANAERVTELVTDARSDHTDDLNFEFIINHRAGDEWLLDPPMNTPGQSGPDDNRIPVPVSRAIRALPGGIPAATPEILQLFKAVSYRDDDRYPRPYDEIDFVALVPLLDGDSAAWLRHAIPRYVPDHPWLAHLP